MSATSSQKPNLDFVENSLIGGAAAVISKTVAAPIERVKLLVQNQGEMLKQGVIAQPYKGIFDCTSRTFRSEGLYSFWRGNLANCIRYFPTQALNFAFKDKINSAFKTSRSDPYLVTFGKTVVSGGIAGALSLCFVYSLDYARTRLANDTSSAKTGGVRQFNGLFDVYKKTVQADGFVGLYRGFMISCVGIVIYRGFYFGLYDTLKPILLNDDANLLLLFSLGYAVTVASEIVSYPFDTVRRRMMMTSGQTEKYKGSFDCFLKIMRKEGFMALMNGAGANIIRGVAGAGVLVGFDKLVDFYLGLKYDAFSA
ncbi:ADP-ATP carrier mitochondrial-like [Brachionus plicatilis]|uniref:ADP/ATP translocase n=1 Tax=Brachionus plicatilis TaxID=10195 RepID=A0A3M7QLT4_BRAPC|nr:ADP-ATP carrier mitochondrial-like [Brachionus plicatilis]